MHDKLNMYEKMKLYQITRDYLILPLVNITFL